MDFIIYQRTARPRTHPGAGHHTKGWNNMEKIQMLCYSGESWDSTPIKERGIYDIAEKMKTKKGQMQIAALIDLQQELGRKIHIKRITGGEK